MQFKIHKIYGEVWVKRLQIWWANALSRACGFCRGFWAVRAKIKRKRRTGWGSLAFSLYMALEDLPINLHISKFDKTILLAVDFFCYEA